MAARTPGARVYREDGYGQTFEPWPMERIRRCVAIVRSRMRGDRSELDEDTDQMMLAFATLHPKLLSMAASEKAADQTALDIALATWDGVRDGSVSKADAAKSIVRKIRHGG